ncbi:MAG: hypothetical protein SOW29_00175, partial [Candidatus Faecousia sp.]|nr:hypothetical protein [Candidatus Faecousia sp.]
ALYGFCWSDESFYLTFAQRLWNGQQLILDEWHPVQFYSAIFYPVLTVYKFFFGTEGIYLFARILYVVLAWGVSLFVLFTFRKYTKPFPAFLCAALVLSYSRGNIWGLSYYNLFLLLTITALCLLLRGRGRRGLLLLSGLCLGFSVLCVPYFALFVLLAVGLALVKREYRKDALWVLGGICVGAVYFLVFFLPRDLGAVIENLSCVLSDPEHSGGPFVNLLAALRDVKLLFYWEAGIVLLGAVLLFLGDRFLPKPMGCLPGLLVSLAGAVLSLWRYRRGETGFAYYPYALFTIPCVLLLYLKRKSSPFAVCLQLTGICMGLAMALSSNTEALAFLVGVTVYVMGVIVMLDLSDQLIIRGFSGGLACMVLLLTFGSRFTTVFRDAPLSGLDTVMTQGPAAGIHTTADHARQYGELVSMLRELEENYGSDAPVFISKLMPWGYLALDNPCGAPTAWRTPVDSPRLSQYYESHPDSIPQIVVVLKPEVGDYDDVGTPNANTLEGWLWDYMEEQQYTSLDYAYARVYVSPLIG